MPTHSYEIKWDFFALHKQSVVFTMACPLPCSSHDLSYPKREISKVSDTQLALRPTHTSVSEDRLQHNESKGLLCNTEGTLAEPLNSGKNLGQFRHCRGLMQTGAVLLKSLEL